MEIQASIDPPRCRNGCKIVSYAKNPCCWRSPCSDFSIPFIFSGFIHRRRGPSSAWDRVATRCGQVPTLTFLGCLFRPSELRVTRFSRC